MSKKTGSPHGSARCPFGRLHVLPTINALLAQHDGLSVRMMLLDRNVGIVEEGIDVAVRIGALADSALRVVTIGSVWQTIVASPAYLAAHGVPAHPADLTAAGRFVRVLADHAPPPTPVSLLYDAGRAAMPAVRAFIDAMRERARQGAWGEGAYPPRCRQGAG